MSKKPQANNLHKSLMILSRKLNIEDYSFVAGTMFQLYTGHMKATQKHMKCQSAYQVKVYYNVSGFYAYYHTLQWTAHGSVYQNQETALVSMLLG